MMVVEGLGVTFMWAHTICACLCS